MQAAKAVIRNFHRKTAGDVMLSSPDRAGRHVVLVPGGGQDAREAGFLRLTFSEKLRLSMSASTSFIETGRI